MKISSINRMALVRAVICFLILVGIRLENALGMSVSCDPLERRMVRAQEVLAGYTSNMNYSEPRPGIHVYRPEFQVREVLKGSRFRVGDVYSEQGDSCSAVAMGGPFLPDPRAGCCIIFLHAGTDGSLRSNYCHESCAKLPRLRRMALVSTHPEDYLDSTELSDRQVILYWIEFNYARGEDYLGWPPPASQPAGISREEAIHFLRQCVDHPFGDDYRLALEILGRFRQVDDFDRFVIAMKSDQRYVIPTGVRGLEKLSDPRAIPIMSAKLEQLQRERDQHIKKWADLDKGKGIAEETAVDSAKSEYEGILFAITHAMDLLTKRNDSPFIRCALAIGLYYEEAKAAEQRNDQTIVDRALERYWNRSIETDVLIGIDDPRINEQARGRMYDNPAACRLLACRGDPAAKDFMLHLLDLGHGDGARWAAETLLPDARARIIGGFARADRFAVGDFVYAMGRYRAFDAVSAFQEHQRAHSGYLGYSFLCGILGITPESTRLDPTLATSESINRRICAVAEKETWSKPQREIVQGLLERPSQMEKSSMQQLLLNNAVPWKPPPALPDMPDARDEKAITAYLSEKRTKVLLGYRSSDGVDKARILYAFRRANLRLPDELIVDAMLDPSDDVRMAARTLLISTRTRPVPHLAPREVRRWALDGDGAATLGAIQYIRTTSGTEYCPTLVEIVKRKWFLFEPQLYDAIIRTHADGCIPLLKPFLEKEHIDLRRRAAAALAMLGDFSGREILLQEAKRRAGVNDEDGKILQQALDVIGRK